MNRVIRESRPISRGRAHCDVCGRRIAPGTRYGSDTVADEGSIWRFNECPACLDVRSYVIDWAEELWEENPRGMTYEWHSEMLGHSSDADYLPRVLSGQIRLTEDAAREAIAAHLHGLNQDASDAEAKDRMNPWSEEEWAAFTWRMRTSRALHPEGVAA
ncbi:hypothetical protein [Actinomyces timonensis]|uniref:hypothetical protein n=1 Tax=Actinomyces timonensis TaxID=1288391 RepID=UPI0002EB8673|nr:hypothetical protein [Actinomyces timonensis]